MLADSARHRLSGNGRACTPRTGPRRTRAVANRAALLQSRTARRARSASRRHQPRRGPGADPGPRPGWTRITSRARTWLDRIRRDPRRRRHAQRRSPGNVGQRGRDRRGRIDSGGSPRRDRRSTGRRVPHPGIARGDECHSCAGTVRRPEREGARRVRASGYRGPDGDTRRGRNASGSRSPERSRLRRTTAFGSAVASRKSRAGTGADDANACRSVRRRYTERTQVEG